MPNNQPCPRCGVRGKVNDTRCLICNGFGVVDDLGMKRYELTQIGLKAGRSPIVPLREETEITKYF